MKPAKMRAKKVTKKLSGAGWSLEVSGTPAFVDRTVKKTVPWLQRFAASIVEAKGRIDYQVSEGEQKGKKK